MERIGFVGLGTMGAAMAANLRRAGFEVTGVEPDAGSRRRTWWSSASWRRLAG